MSDTSLHSGLYARIRDFAELLDDALIDLKEDKNFQQEHSIKRLGELLLAMADERRKDLVAQLLQAILKEKLAEGTKDLKELGEILMSAPTTPETIARLEAIAKILEQERATTFAKMRGY